MNNLTNFNYYYTYMNNYYYNCIKTILKKIFDNINSKQQI